MKYDITVVQAKSIVVTTEADSADKAVTKAWMELGNAEEHFSKRIGTMMIAAVRERDKD